MDREENLARFLEGNHPDVPRVVYHGSPDVRPIFKEGFKPQVRGNVHFATDNYSMASSYADPGRAWDYQNSEPHVIPLHISMKNPMVIDAKGAHWKETEKYVRAAKDAGHDGLIIKNSVDYYNNSGKSKQAGNVYAWFDPTQAKSAVEGQLRSRVDQSPIQDAIQNQGTFDPSNPDITKAEGGGLTAYHGSPYDFDEFDVSKIGTGEGAQAYGHGLYFAENLDVARGYRDALTPGSVTKFNVGSRSLDDIYNQTMSRADSAPIKAAQRDYDRLALLDTLHDKGDVLGVQENAEQHSPEALEWFNREIAPNLSRQGRLYEVQIDAHPDHFIDWDKPLIQQSPKVQSMMDSLGEDDRLSDGFKKELQRARGTKYFDGSDLYAELMKAVGKQEVSKMLLDHDVRGIRYKDAGSRGDRGEPTHNYVVFDHSHVKVRRKYEQGGAVDPEYHQTPEFQNWFGNSVAHQDGVPVTYYHGTSKDVDFPSFKVGNHGVWLTSDPKEASSYAEENDSQNLRYEGGKYMRTNTASRVIPVHLNAENPYRGEKPEDMLHKQNYKKAQSDWFSQLRAQGYDSWIPDSQGGALAVALKDPTQIKSIYNRTFDPKNKRMDKAAGGKANPAVNKAIHVISKTGSSPREAVTLSKRLLGRQ